MKTILLHINDDNCMQSRLQAAMDIARATNGHITCLQAVSYEVFAPGDFAGNAMAAAMPLIKEAAESFRKEVETELSNEDVSWEWRYLHGAAEQHLLEQSALHDIIVVGPHDVGDEGSRGPSRMAGELALDAPTPVLVVPSDATGLQVRAPVLVAWNGLAEAAIALRSALPLLKMSQRVFLATVGEDKDRERFEFPTSEAARYLSRAGIDVEIVDMPSEKGKIADILTRAAEARECGMIVMGAYGHSRLAEMLLGGVTRSMLSEPKLPVLLAH